MRQFFSFFLALLSTVTLVAKAPCTDCVGTIHLGTAPICPTTVLTHQYANNSLIGTQSNTFCFANHCPIESRGFNTRPSQLSAGIKMTNQMAIVMDTLFLPVLTTTDTTLCQDNHFVLAQPVDSLSTSTYLWVPATGLSNATIANPVASPSASTLYTLYVTSQDSTLRDTLLVNIIVKLADVNIAGADSIEICLGAAVPLAATASPAGGTIGWAPSFFVSPTTGVTTTVTTDESTWVYATYNVNGCVARDSAYIRVDSLPANLISIFPAKPFYCPGDTIILASPTYEPANFPDIKLFWPPVFAGEQTPDSLWNMVIFAQEGVTTYTRYINNNACSDTSTVVVTVVTPVEFIITGDTEICSGESTQLMVTSNPPNTAVEWKDATTGLSCTNCPNPIATPTTTMAYTVSAKDAQCPDKVSITIEVNFAPNIEWPDTPSVCLGGSRLLNKAIHPGATYNWTGVGITMPTSDMPLVSPLVSTTYTVTITSNKGCSRVDSKLIEVFDATVNAGVNQTVCHGAFANLTGTATGSPGTITWQPGGLTGNNATTSEILFPTNFIATYNYGGIANCKAFDTVLINHFMISGIKPVEILDSILNGATICYGTSIRVRVTTDPPNLPISWVANGITQPETTQTLTITPKVTRDSITEFNLDAYTTDANGCPSRSDRGVNLRVRRCYDIPDAFTPNGDMSNDTFGPVNPFTDAAIPLDQFLIFNRWGQQIWEATTVQPRWDGKVGGVEAPMDTYIFNFVVRFPDGSSEKRTGQVTLLR
jgi:gliding motility-associated-like protein